MNVFSLDYVKTADQDVKPCMTLVLGYKVTGDENDLIFSMEVN